MDCQLMAVHTAYYGRIHIVYMQSKYTEEEVKPMRKSTKIILCCLLTLSLLSPGFKGVLAKAEDKVTSLKMKGNLLKISTADDFSKGTTDKVTLDDSIGDGAIKLEEGATEGSFLSAVYEAVPYTTMVACWNAAIYGGTEIEVWARARHDGAWTDWLTWGSYSPFKNRGSKENKDCADANVDQDTFSMKDEKTADAVQMKVELRRDKADLSSPVVRMLTMTFKGGDMVPAYAEEPLKEIPDQVLIEAPAYSQKIRHPALEADICSPTALTVLMNSRDKDLGLLPEELALNMKDEAEDIFGSWSFGTASPGLYGFQSYAQFCDQNILLQELAKEHTLAVTVKYTNNKDNEDLPYLDGANGETKGHLIALIGYEYEDGIRDDDHLYIYSSDSFCDSDQTAYRRYKWSQFKDCLKGLAYIIPDRKREVEAPYITGVVRENVELEPVKGQENAFRFMKDGKTLDMKRFTKGNGIFACTVQGAAVNMKKDMVEGPCSIRYEKAVQSPVNNIFFYDIPCQEDGTISIDREAVFEKMGIEDQGQAITVYAISDRGYRYQATIQ